MLSLVPIIVVIIENWLINLLTPVWDHHDLADMILKIIPLILNIWILIPLLLVLQTLSHYLNQSWSTSSMTYDRLQWVKELIQR